jgi:hypothetical protein
MGDGHSSRRILDVEGPTGGGRNPLAIDQHLPGGGQELRNGSGSVDFFDIGAHGEFSVRCIAFSPAGLACKPVVSGSALGT